MILKRFEAARLNEGKGTREFMSRNSVVALDLFNIHWFGVDGWVEREGTTSSRST